MLDAAVVLAARARLQEGRARLVEALRAASPATSGAPEYTRGLSDLYDAIVSDLRAAALEKLHAEHGHAAAEVGEGIAFVALGGYGRREMCPRSDVDLLFLLPEESGGEHQLVDLVLYGLWDLGLEVGHAVRTVSDCLKIAREDQSAKTALLDARPIAGSRRRFESLESTIDAYLQSGDEAQIFIGQKLEEADRRDERCGNTIYLLEPDVKSGEGGVREIHTAVWIARARWRKRTVSELVRIGELSPREAKALSRANEFLLRVRIELHLQAGRRRETLGFELQDKIAQALDYTRRGTEGFMRAYYFHARVNRRISKLIIERAASDPRRALSALHPTEGGFQTIDGKVTVADPAQLTRDPSALLRIFRVAQEESREIYSYAKDQIVGSLAALDRAKRRDPGVVDTFLSIIDDPKDGGETFEQMHELGVLKRIIPELGRVTSRWQRSLYHVYTVDVHSVFAVKKLHALRTGELAGDVPELERRFAELPRPAVLYLAALLHDVGKGWKKGDHSLRGERVAHAVGARFEAAGVSRWTAEETEDLAWLVKNHLVMSDLSQRRDISDPELIRSFAADCGNIERLTMLWILTVADMMATSPKVWTTWKAALLLELFEKTRATLAGSADHVSTGVASHLQARRARIVEEILAEAASHRHTVARELAAAFARALPERYLFSVPSRRLFLHFEAWREVGETGAVSIHIEHHERDHATELTISCPDRPGLLSTLAGTLTANRLSILSAQIFSIDLPAPGRRAAVDVIWLADAAGGICEEMARWAQVQEDLRKAILGELDVDKLVHTRTRGSTLPKRPKPKVETKLVIARDASRTETVIDVFCQDHLGVLYTITKALAEQGLSISLAKISTQGDHVADGFYLTDAKTGRRIDDEARLELIKASVRAAIERAEAL